MIGNLLDLWYWNLDVWCLDIWFLECRVKRVRARARVRARIER
jgi:hypothetical protein